MCKDGRLCGFRGNQLESDRKSQPTLTDEERQVIFRAMYRAAGADSAILWSLLERTR
jgi:hypothetical protein